MSAAAIAARNIANAQNSTGPATAEGKARSSQNALRHGLTSNKVVLAHENADEFKSLRQSFLDTHRPATEREEQLVIRMVEAWWRLNRAYRVETEFLQQSADAMSEAHADLTSEGALAAIFLDSAKSRNYRLFLRYLTNAENAYRHACTEFEKVRRERLQREQKERLLAAMSSPKTSQLPHKPAAPNGDLLAGFVSQTTAAKPESRPELDAITTRASGNHGQNQFAA